MEKLHSIEDLEPWDTPQAYPDRSWWASEGSALEQDVARAVARIRRLTNLSFATSGPSEFQDGALFMCAQEYELDVKGRRAGTLSGFCFSKFGRLVSATRLHEKSAVPLVLWERLLEILSTDYAFRIVDDALVQMPYAGVFKARRCQTWGERFFCQWYS